MNGEITFSHITLKDDAGKRLILNNISFHIDTGKFIAFVGGSGAGKSSLFKLLLGLCKENSGEIKIDNHHINHLNMNHLRKQIAVVLQNTSLLPGSIYSNISANANISMDEAWELAECIGLDEEIMQMPMKMLTHITDNAGESISGGQKQKILIARALASKPKILLLDEATSSLDNQSQYRVYQHLKTLNITRIIIAHRISTIQITDRIYVMDQGCIIDSSTYAELGREIYSGAFSGDSFVFFCKAPNHKRFLSLYWIWYPLCFSISIRLSTRSCMFYNFIYLLTLRCSKIWGLLLMEASILTNSFVDSKYFTSASE